MLRGNSRTAIGSIMPSRSRMAGTPKMAFDERQDRFFLDHAHFDERFTEPQTLLRTFGQGLIELFGRDEVGADQLLAERRPAGRAAAAAGTATTKLPGADGRGLIGSD